MTKRMRRDVLELGGCCVLMNEGPGKLASQWISLVDKNTSGRAAMLREGAVEVSMQPLDGLSADGNLTFFITFAMAQEDSVFQIYVLMTQSNRFGDSEPGRVECFEEGAIAEPV